MRKRRLKWKKIFVSEENKGGRKGREMWKKEESRCIIVEVQIPHDECDHYAYLNYANKLNLQKVLILFTSNLTMLANLELFLVILTLERPLTWVRYKKWLRVLYIHLHCIIVNSFIWSCLQKNTLAFLHVILRDYGCWQSVNPCIPQISLIPIMSQAHSQPAIVLTL